MSLSTKIEYRGARLQLEISDEHVQLRINGIVRDETPTGDVQRLSSTVQTDYEWHEFIEAVVAFTDRGIQASLLANGQELISQQHPVPVSP